MGACLRMGDLPMMTVGRINVLFFEWLQNTMINQA